MTGVGQTVRRLTFGRIRMSELSMASLLFVRGDNAGRIALELLVY